MRWGSSFFTVGIIGREKNNMKINNLRGQKFGRLIARYALNRRSADGHIIWNCICDCGNINNVKSNNLINGGVKSCGCLSREIGKIIHCNNKHNYKHGDSHTGIHNIWILMRSRCHSPKNKSYKYYGARGIRVCKDWHNFLAFKKWALENGYKKGLSIDRVDRNRNYEPNNCQWITLSENVSKSNRENPRTKKHDI